MSKPKYARTGDSDRGTINKGIFEWHGTPPAWVIEGTLATAITQINESISAMHESPSAKMSLPRHARAVYINAFSALKDAGTQLSRCDKRTLSGKHKVVAAALANMLPVLSRQGVAIEDTLDADGEPNDNEVSQGFSLLLRTIEDIHILLKEDTDKSERFAIVGKWKLYAEGH